MKTLQRAAACTLLLGLLTACGPTSDESRLYGPVSQCKAKEDLKDSSEVLKGGIDFFLSSIPKFIPPLGAITSLLPIDLGLDLIFGQLFKGCDTAAARIDWFTLAAEERFSALETRLDRVEFEGIRRDLSTGAGSFAGKIGVIAQKLEEIAFSFDSQNQTLDVYHLSDAKDRFLELAQHFSTLTVLVRSQASLPYISGLYQTAVPAGIAAAFLADQLAAILEQASTSNAATLRLTHENLKLFRANFGDFLHALATSKSSLPGIGVELLTLPDFSTQEDSSPEHPERYRLQFKGPEAVTYRIRAFGQILHQGSLDLTGKWVHVQLKPIGLSAKDMDEHPQILAALGDALRTAHPELSRRLQDAQSLVDAIDSEAIQKLKLKLNWQASAPDPTFPSIRRPKAPFGSAFQGRRFDDEETLSSSDEIEEITLQGGQDFLGICMKQKAQSIRCHGDRSRDKMQLRLETGEFIVKAEVSARPLRDSGAGSLALTRVTGLRVVTNLGRELKAGSRQGALTQVYEAPQGWQIIAWFGRENAVIHSLAPLYAQQPSIGDPS